MTPEHFCQFMHSSKLLIFFFDRDTMRRKRALIGAVWQGYRFGMFKFYGVSFADRTSAAYAVLGKNRSRVNVGSGFCGKGHELRVF